MHLHRWASTSDGPRYWRGYLNIYTGKRSDARTRTALELHADVGWLNKAEHCGIEVGSDDEAGVRASIKLWRLVNVWVSAGSPALSTWRYKRRVAKKADPRKALRDEMNWFSVAVHNGAVWWEVWHPRHSWTSGTPRWRHGHFNPVDTFAGRTETVREVVYETLAEVQMPEGVYPARVQIERWARARRRWPAKFSVSSNVDILQPDGSANGYIPIPGKGENSWDCGPDGTFGQSGPLPEEFLGIRRLGLGPAQTLADKAVAHAINEVRESTLKTRARRGSSPDYAEPIPRDT